MLGRLASPTHTHADILHICLWWWWCCLRWQNCGAAKFISRPAVLPCRLWLAGASAGYSASSFAYVICCMLVAVLITP